MKTLKVKESTHSELAKMGVWGESMDSIIAKLLTSYREKEIKEKKRG